ncbi:MAG: DEAD/DEAH box helicase family protein [Rikenellaceae bacterium]
MAKQNKEQTRLVSVLVLNRFLLSLFGVSKLEELTIGLKEESLEQRDEENISYFYYALKSKLYSNTNFTSEQLLTYDQNIYRHTAHISENRDELLKWKYFQYLSLLFTEIYLDRYFSDKSALLNQINEFLSDSVTENPEFSTIEPFTENDLNKLAFWNATGSGKTLIMHLNILQYRHYAEKKGVNNNRVILLTPNEGLSAQHLSELRASNIEAEIFTKSGGSMFYGKLIEIIDINKLADKDGDKTVAVGSFEGSNLVLVDEGHKGTGGEVWKGYRDSLCADGFSFEYSATFGQSVGAISEKKKRNKLLNEYGKAILFDYSYRYFYKDGYGKDYRILNIKEDKNDTLTTMYLTACLLSFFEQQIIFESAPQIKNNYLVEKPLAIFVGGSVTKEMNESNSSDVVAILKFFERFIANAEESRRNIAHLLNGSDGLVDKNNQSIFGSSFKFIHNHFSQKDAVYSSMIQKLFNSNVVGARLHLDNLKGQKGEIGLRIGNSDYFGVINVGDDSKLLSICEKQGLLTEQRDFSRGSLFQGINKNDSTVNVLIGSKKFSEGWSSWRVSTMGLLNVGQGEGSQIIQLFGRGVRLKGYKHSLKRSAKLETKEKSVPKDLSTLETLNIFGIRADYMEQFKKYLNEEGLPLNDSTLEEIVIPMLPTVNLSSKGLKYIKVKEGKDFKKEVVVSLSDGIGNKKITLDWYPKVQLLRSDSRSDAYTTIQNEAKLSDINLAYLDWDKIFFDLQHLKNDKSWYNFEIDYNKIEGIINDGSWYRLLIPQKYLEPTNFVKDVADWQDIVSSLLKKYCDVVYNRRKAAWMAENSVIAILDETHPNFQEEYKVLVNRDLDKVIVSLKELKENILNNTFVKDISVDGDDFNALFFEPHLYQPLLSINSKKYRDSESGVSTITIQPVSLVDSEKQFVVDLKEYHSNNSEFFADKELYLLRNQSRRGIGFFEANGFYPDFILWIVTDEKQYIAFIDPKGLRQLDGGLNNPKIELHKTIKDDIEPRLKDDSISLSSFIVTPTPFEEIKHWCGSVALSNQHNLFFQKDQPNVYIDKILSEIIIG